jgi:hypothetical protein
MMADVGVIATESAGFTVTVALLDVATRWFASVTFMYTEYTPVDEEVKVHEAAVALETAAPSRYH